MPPVHNQQPLFGSGLTFRQNRSSSMLRMLFALLRYFTTQNSFPKLFNRRALRSVRDERFGLGGIRTSPRRVPHAVRPPWRDWTPFLPGYDPAAGVVRL